MILVDKSFIRYQKKDTFCYVSGRLICEGTVHNIGTASNETELVVTFQPEARISPKGQAAFLQKGATFYCEARDENHEIKEDIKIKWFINDVFSKQF